MRFRTGFIILLLTLFACQKEDIIQNKESEQKQSNDGQNQEEKEDTPKPDDNTYKGLIPEDIDCLPEVWINTPGAKGVWDKYNWVELSTIEIKAGKDGSLKSVFKADSVKIKGRGNTTWWSYPKKPYRFNLSHKANFIGSGETRKWVLLANWMDRPLLRNAVAFEAARQTSIERTPSGTFVEFYLDGNHLGNYWMGEKINVEKGNFLADYLLEFDTSDGNGGDFQSAKGSSWHKPSGGLPVNIKYPDLDDTDHPADTIKAAKKALKTIEAALYVNNNTDVIDIDSFADWFLVYELTLNGEPGHPKSCYMYIRDGKLYAGPVWDFDWGTFPAKGRVPKYFINKDHLYYNKLFTIPAFKTRLKERWVELKPKFADLADYIDQQANWIRASESVNHVMWDCYPNPSGEENGMVNYDENLSFDEAVKTMRESLLARIVIMDKLIKEL